MSATNSDTYVSEFVALIPGTAKTVSRILAAGGSGGGEGIALEGGGDGR
jgi:hypothetical protein